MQCRNRQCAGGYPVIHAPALQVCATINLPPGQVAGEGAELLNGRALSRAVSPFTVQEDCVAKEKDLFFCDASPPVDVAQFGGHICCATAMRPSIIAAQSGAESRPPCDDVAPWWCISMYLLQPHRQPQCERELYPCALRDVSAARRAHSRIRRPIGPPQSGSENADGVWAGAWARAGGGQNRPVPAALLQLRTHGIFRHTSTIETAAAVYRGDADGGAAIGCYAIMGYCCMPSPGALQCHAHAYAWALAASWHMGSTCRRRRARGGTRLKEPGG